jgi:hypothetical protein
MGSALDVRSERIQSGAQRTSRARMRIRRAGRPKLAQVSMGPVCGKHANARLNSCTNLKPELIPAGDLQGIPG